MFIGSGIYGLQGRRRASSVGPVEWDISAASYDSKSLDMSADLGSYPWAITFKPDGTEVYAVDKLNTTVHQYSLSAAWDISTATHTTSGPVPASGVTGIYFKPDGTQAFFTDDSGDDLIMSNLGTAWDVSTLSGIPNETGNLGYSGILYGSWFKDDGTEFYYGLDGSPDYVVQYTLSIPWNVTSLSSFPKTLASGSQDASPRQPIISPSGKVALVCGETNDSIFQYDLSTAWDISTSVYNSVSFNCSAQTNYPRGIYVSPDGHKMYIMGLINSTIYQYSL